MLLAAVSLMPTLLVDIPAMADYPNHLARMHVLADAGTSNENPFYEVRFALYPNLAIDLIVPQLGRVLNVEIAMRFFFLSAQLLVIFGAIALELASKRRHQISAFAALLTLHSLPFSLGFVNFEFGVGVALFGIASWIAFQTRNWQLRFTIHIVFVCVLFLAHFFALGIYGLAIGLYELQQMFARRLDLRRATMLVLMLASPVLALLAILYVTGGAIGGSKTEWLLSWKLVWITLFLNGYNVYLSAGSVAALLVLLTYLALKRSLDLSCTGRWTGLGFLIAFIAIPFQLFDVRMADIRMITAAILILPAFLHFRPVKNAAYVAGIIIFTLIVFNVGYAAHIWLSYRSDYAEMKTSFALLKPYSFVLVGNSRTGEVAPSLLTDVPMQHAPVLAVHYAKAFVSSLYTFPGANPVEVRPDLKHLDVSTATEDYHPRSLTMLRALASRQDVPDAPGYLRNWTRDFQYVYLIGPHTEDAIPGVLVEVARYRRFTLYAVRK
jgi:hypothetical protein